MTEIFRNNEEGIFRINSKPFTDNDFLHLDLNNSSLGLFHVNIAFRNKCLENLHNLLSFHKALNSGCWNM